MRKRAVCIFVTIITIFTITFQNTYALLDSFDSASPALAAKMPGVEASSAILIDAEKGQILYQKSINKRLHISVANKIMSCLVAIESLRDNLTAKVTISKEAADVEGSALNLEVGEKYSAEELLYAVMITSANDATLALAEHIGGDTEGFVTLMNNKAGELNLKDTHFTNTTGLYDESQYTTAYDLALLTRHAVNTSPVFNRMFSTHVKPWARKNGENIILTSQNQLFFSYDGVDGGKTGYNQKNLQSAVTTVTRGSQKLICVVLDSPENAVFTDSVNILNFGFEHYRKDVLVQRNTPVETVVIEGIQVGLVSRIDVNYTHPVGESYVKKIDLNIFNPLSPPIEVNKVIGTARYVLNDNTVIDVSLYPDKEVSAPVGFWGSLKNKFLQNRDILILALILVFVEAAIILYHLIRLVSRFILRHVRKKTIAQEKTD
jgi:D-alanyl-D-alanine carboxypeptidase (penicillin-binding protein 5/6)